MKKHSFSCIFKKNDYISYSCIYLLLWEMNLRELEKITKELPCFSIQQIKLFEPDFLRWNLKNWHEKWYLDRITKWRYCFSSLPKLEENSYIISHSIYQPSYISMESALRYYNLIPEWVFITTACSSKKTQKFTWDRWTFYYYHIKPSLFRGYETKKTQYWSFYLATPEKLICDFFYLKPNLKKSDIPELRIDFDLLYQLTTRENIESCAKKFNNKRLSNIISDFISYK